MIVLLRTVQLKVCGVVGLAVVASCGGPSGSNPPAVATAGSGAGGARAMGGGPDNVIIFPGGATQTGGSPVVRTGGAPALRTGGTGPTQLTGGTAATSTGGSGTTSNCGMQLGTKPCGTGQTCSWTEAASCTEGHCDCISGAWACTSVTGCADCPGFGEVTCGDTCDGAAGGCQCRCGGGPNYVPCLCSQGSWQCAQCGN